MITPFNVTFTRKLSDEIKPKDTGKILSAIQQKYTRLVISESTIENGKFSFTKNLFSGRRNLLSLVDSGSVELDVYSHTITFMFSTKRTIIIHICLTLLTFLYWGKLAHFGVLYICLGSFAVFRCIQVLSGFATKVTNSINDRAELKLEEL